MIQFCNRHRVDSEYICKEYELPFALIVPIDDSADLVRILLHSQLAGHIADRIWPDAWFGRESALPFHRLEVVVVLSFYDEVCSDALDVMKALEVIATSIEDVERVLLVRYGIHCFHVMDSCRGNVKECRNLGLQIIQGMYLDAAFLFPEQRPFKDVQA